jgi:hypothetical protein
MIRAMPVDLPLLRRGRSQSTRLRPHRRHLMINTTMMSMTLPGVLPKTLKFKWSAWKSNAKIEGYYVYIGTFPGGEMLRTQISIRIGSLHG